MMEVGRVEWRAGLATLLLLGGGCRTGLESINVAGAEDASSATDASSAKDASVDGDAQLPRDAAIIPDRDDLSPLVRYWIREATSGQSPSELVDDTVEPFNVPLLYPSTQSPVFGDIVEGGNTHLRFDPEAVDTGGARATIGSKLSKIQGSPQATLEVKYQRGPCTDEQPRVFGLSQSGSVGSGAFYMRELDAHDGLILRSLRSSRWSFFHLQQQCPIRSISVVHWVVDTREAVEADRVRAYINGTRQPVVAYQGGPYTGRFPAENDGMDIGTETELLLGSPESDTDTRTADMHLWYAALYDKALNELQIARQAKRLQQNDDQWTRVEDENAGREN